MLLLTLLLGSWLLLPSYVSAGFGPPVSTDQLYQQLAGKPCDCRGGTTQALSSLGTSLGTADCGSQTAHLLSYSSSTGGSRGSVKWVCVPKPAVIPNVRGRPGPCPTVCTATGASLPQVVHSTCYATAQTCTINNVTYFTATLTRLSTGSTGGEGDFSSTTGVNHRGQAGCGHDKKVGDTVCWPQTSPVHLSDGGGPTDQVRQILVEKRLEELAAAHFPSLAYHPLVLPKHKPTDLDFNTMSILNSALQALNNSNPTLAQDCWLCMAMGTPIPLALPSNLSSPSITSSNCTISSPFRTQPMGLVYGPCLFSNTTNDDTLDVGFFPLNCTSIHNSTTPACPAPQHVFICGNSLAFTALPANWSGLCAQALLLPDIDILPGDQPVPVPALDLFPGRSKRALAFIPLMAGLGLTTAMASRAAGVGVAVHTYQKLSLQLIEDVTTLSGTISDLQDQTDSLAEVVLQNRRGLDFLTAEQRGICLALQDRCCFYANKSGIVRDKVKKLQDDLLRRKKQLLENPFLTGFHGLLPYLLPILSPLLGLLLILSFGPWAWKTLTTFIKQQIDNILAKPIHVHYHQLAMADAEEQGPPKPGPRYIDI